MAEGAELISHPSHYPRDGTYADLLCWHMDYWGTRPKGSTAVNGEPWTKSEFKQEFWGEESSETNARMLLGNWRGNGSAPGPEHGATVSRILFGDNLIFNGWASDLETARKRSQGKKNNPQTARFPDPPPVNATIKPVPRPTAYFIGRDAECNAMAELLAGADASSLLVQGGPGIGKTELTKAIAHHPAVVSRFGERRFFVSLETAKSATDMWVAIAKAVGRDPASANEKRQRTLLVLDNLETPWEPPEERGATQDHLATLAAVAGTSLLASFRGLEVVDGVRWDLQHRVKPLAHQAAVGLFESLAGHWVQGDPHFRDFMRELGGVPLAIRLVALQAHSRSSLSRLWREWIRIGTDLARDPDFQESRLTSVGHSIELSVQSSRMNFPAGLLFRFLGCSGGLSEDEVGLLMDDLAGDAEERLLRTGLAIERNGRIDLLPPVREHALRHHKRPDEIIGRCNTIIRIGDDALRRRDFSAAKAAYDLARNLYDEIDDEIGQASCMMRVADLAHWRRDYTGAGVLYISAHSFCSQIGYEQGIEYCRMKIFGV